MDVVRFKEEDVIVASVGNPTHVLANFHNGTTEDATIDGKNPKDFITWLASFGATNVYFKYDGKDAVHFDDILLHEEDGRLEDGEYNRRNEGDNVIWYMDQKQ